MACKVTTNTRPLSESLNEHDTANSLTAQGMKTELLKECKAKKTKVPILPSKLNFQVRKHSTRLLYASRYRIWIIYLTIAVSVREDR